ncbi:MAG: hypothetical protein WC979_06605 [Candidatus Pacearchaeota archaeon]|jgi:hypothetical protein
MIIDRVTYPHEVNARFGSEPEGRKCFSELSRAFNAYDGQSHHEFDFHNIQFYFRTTSERDRFSRQAKDITKRLLDNESESKATISP